MVRIFVVVQIILTCCVKDANAATFRKQGDTIYMTGQIVATDPLRLSALLDRGARRIVLHSRGGLVAAGSYMAEMIRSARLTTIVREECASACTIMYYAGARRQLSGRLGFHRATDSLGTATYAEQIRRYGAPRAAVDAVTSTPLNRMKWFR